MSEKIDSWWANRVIYQIYPRSFSDSDGDGIGDIKGIIDKIDYLEQLGIGAIWLSPIHASPQNDNGYDISDYYSIDPLYGTLEDFDTLLSTLHSRDIKLILDLAFNHTSSKHQWFEESRSNKSNNKRDWYIWREGSMTPAGERVPPNNWGSYFSGPAWTFEPNRNEFYLHLFSETQPDLNWDNPSVRKEIIKVMNWWADRGVDGFRLDVINFISKHPDHPAGEELENGYEDGSKWFAHGPRLYDYLREIREGVTAGRDNDILFIGETPEVSKDQAGLLTDRSSGPLDMVFQFEHMNLDQVGKDKWILKPISAIDVFDCLCDWQAGLNEAGWNSLYLCNHDQPRPVSRIGDEAFRFHSATALAMALHFMRGTPYIFQGEEIGMSNVPILSFDDVHDVESRNFYLTARKSGISEATILEILRRKGRDNSRSPMQWSSGYAAGFSTGCPWMGVNPNYEEVNVDSELSADTSILKFYRNLIDVRKSCSIISHGSFERCSARGSRLLVFKRALHGDEIAVIVNLASSSHSMDPLVTDCVAPDDIILSNYAESAVCAEKTWKFKPWEACAFYLTRS